LQLLKEMGCNGVRLSHNPNAPALLDLCDRLGLFVFNEAFCNWGRLDDNGIFARTWTPQLEEFVRRDRNHPSVFIWSVGNQVSAADRAPDFGRKDFDAMASVVRKLDGSRPVTSALRTIRWDGNNITTKFKDGDDSQPHPLGLHMDIMSANYMEQWFAKDRIKYPKLAFITSECNTRDDGRGAWAALDRDNAIGLFYWGGINYIGESNRRENAVHLAGCSKAWQVKRQWFA
jgi:beta-galactosidase